MVPQGELGMNGKSEPDISLVLPCWNERDNIRSVMEKAVGALESLGRTWELLVIDNHSDDGTPTAARTASKGDRRIRVIVHESNRFYSGSCQTALREARGRHVAIMDSDGQFSAGDLGMLSEALEKGANLVFGWRKRRCDPWSRKAMSLVFNALAKLWLGYPYHDLNVGIRMFDRRFAATAVIRHRLNLANPELYVCARQQGLRIAEVPVRHFARDRGQTCHNFRKLFKLFVSVNGYFRGLRNELRKASRGQSGDGVPRRQNTMPMVGVRQG
jgi:glycosyltransferase involved in cell wall biosynthesis